MEQDSKAGSTGGRRNLASILAWILIGVLFVLTAVWVVWGSHQPRLHSIFSADE